MQTLTDLLNPENKNLKIRENTEVKFVPVSGLMVDGERFIENGSLVGGPQTSCI